MGDIKLTAGQVDRILEAYPDTQRVYANGPGRNQFIDQVVRVLLLSGEGERRKLTETEAFKSQLMYSAASILAKLADAEIRSQAQGDEAFLKAYYEAPQGRVRTGACAPHPHPRAGLSPRAHRRADRI